ncbi:MAG TPA: aminoglycoside phosphotransferase family protein [Micromonosporaceae bacterium]|nr:aminoglycoside phosphotransferase family protein [Micromonosporaceae bacterium]
MIDVAEILAFEFGLTVRAIEANDEGIDRAAQRFRVYADGSHSDPRWYAVKWSSGGSIAGLLTPAALADASVDGVPGPLRARDGRPWTDQTEANQPSTVEPRRFSVVPWVGDHQAIESGLNQPQWRAFGRLLAAVHGFRVPDALRAALPAVRHDRELAAVTRTDELVASDRPGLDRDVAALWRENRDRLLAAADAVPHLAAHIEPAVLCHADPHLGNVLAGNPGAGDADAVWLVDWDDVVLATPELDLMFVLGATYGDEHIGERERDWFATGYLGDESPTAHDLRRAADATRLRYYRLVRALIDVADLAAEALVPDTEPVWRATASRLVAANLSPDGLLALGGY